MALDPLSKYLIDIREIRGTGAAVDETSYYGPLATLLNTIGSQLKPRVKCVINLKNQGAGLPDGGLFTADQLKGDPSDPLIKGLLPSRGAVEVKGTADALDTILQTEQVRRYWKKYGQVLVTNLREFVVVGTDPEGAMATYERFAIAQTEGDFWGRQIRHLVPDSTRLADYLRRSMVRPAPLASPEALAWLFAAWAREAKARLAKAPAASLADIRRALEGSLGIKFEGAQGDRFFRSTLVQTLFYGLFSAWVLWSKLPAGQSGARFDWKLASWTLRVPMISSLFEQLTLPTKLAAMDIVEILDWAGEALNRVPHDEFFKRFQQEHAVQYFYEPFLQAFDPELRKQLGVWYTPPEIVEYMVERVDRALRSELGVVGGLSNPNVLVLDPAVGTGSYLVAVLARIAHELRRSGANDDLLANDLRRAALDRLFGFELLPAPFVVAHLQIGLLLDALGAPLSIADRAPVYLTNSLTGWTHQSSKPPILFQEFEAERDSADEVKQEKRILVVLGNPPYNAFAGVATEAEDKLLQPYRAGLASWGITKNYLNDLYVRFYRVAERRITEMTGTGIVSFISNFSYLGDPSFVVMRERFLSEFDSLWFDNLNGSSRETGKTTPKGDPDPSIFSTPLNPAGIRVGTAIALMVRTPDHSAAKSVKYRELWGTQKRSDLLDSLSDAGLDSGYLEIQPSRETRYSFRRASTPSDFDAWPALPALAAIAPMLGLNENRDGALQDLDHAALVERMREYLDPTVPWQSVSSTGLKKPAAGFDPEAVRTNALALEPFDLERIAVYLRRPFDVGSAYLSAVPRLWNRSRPELRAQVSSRQRFLLTRPSRAAADEGVPVSFSRVLGEQDALRGHAYFMPYIDESSHAFTQGANSGLPLTSDGGFTPNLSAKGEAYLADLGIIDVKTSLEAATLIWSHALAITCSPLYRASNRDALATSWPRVPLPGTREILTRSAALGRSLESLIDTTNGVTGLDIGTVQPGLLAFGRVSSIGSRALDLAAGDLGVEAPWGVPTKSGVMPAAGQLERRLPSRQETTDLEVLALASGLDSSVAAEALGPDVVDVYLNDRAFWSGLPIRVWDYTVGGYQVLKKWLSYRDGRVLGRSLTVAEARQFTAAVRRIIMILLLEPALDRNFLDVLEASRPW